MCGERNGEEQNILLLPVSFAAHQNFQPTLKVMKVHASS